MWTVEQMNSDEVTRVRAANLNNLPRDAKGELERLKAPGPRKNLKVKL